MSVVESGDEELWIGKHCFKIAEYYRANDGLQKDQDTLVEYPQSND